MGRSGGGDQDDHRLRVKLRKILARHTPPAPPDGAVEKIAAVLREAEASGSKH